MEKSIKQLFDCLKNDSDGTKLARLQDITCTDWEAVASEAANQRILPNLYQALRPYQCSLSIPAATEEIIRSAYYKSAVRNMKIFTQLLELLKLFHDRDIKVILLKGAHLAELVYGNLALRPMSDLDLLVKEKDLKFIHEQLLYAGYTFLGENPQSNTKHLAPYRKRGGVAIEIHFHIADPPYSERISTAELWDRSKLETLHDQAVHVLSPEDLLLHICQHTCIQHCFDNGIISVFDIAKIIEHYRQEIDWDILFQRAETWGIKRAVILMLKLAEKIEGTTIPESLQSKLLPDQDLAAPMVVAETLLLNKRKQPVSTTRHLARLFDHSSWPAKITFIRQQLMPSGSVSYEGHNRVAALNLYQKLIFYSKMTKDRLNRHGKTIYLVLRRNPQAVQAMQEENKKNQLRDWLSQAGF